MSDNLALERADLYQMFSDVADGLEVEFDAEEVWMFDDHEQEIDEVVDDVTETYQLGALGTFYTHIKVIAAIAFCDKLEIKVYDYVGAGGEKYEDD